MIGQCNINDSYKLYYDSILTPIMISNNEPNGLCFCSHPYSSYQPWMAFDRTYGYNVNYFHSSNAMPQYIGYKFVYPVCVSSVRLTNGQSSSWTGRMPGVFNIEASDDGNIYTIISKHSIKTAYYQNTFDNNIIPNINKWYYYWRLYITESCTSDNYMNISGIDFFGYRRKCDPKIKNGET